MTAIPKTPCPVRGLIPFQKGVWPVVHRKPHPILMWLYTVHERDPDRGLRIWCNVSQEDIVEEMDAYSRFKVGDRVSIGALTDRTILKRRWDFEAGTMKYLITGIRPGKEFVLAQDQLLAKIGQGES